MKLPIEAYYRNRLMNCSNPYQGESKKVLCVCSAGLLRSPTAAYVFSNKPYNYNTRAAGIQPSYALIVVDDILVTWADEIVCMTSEQREKLEEMIFKLGIHRFIINLEIIDDYSYRDPALIKLIKRKYKYIMSDSE